VGTLLHGRHDLYLTRPIVPGDVLSTRAQVTGIHARSTGVVVTVLADTRDAAREPVNKQYFTAFFRKAEHTGDAGRTAPGHRMPEGTRAGKPLTTVAQKLDQDQTFRYAEASGDTMPVHLDEEFARGVGLPGLIVHGRCTLAFATHALLAHLSPNDPGRLRRLAVQFSAPARPGQTISTTVWSLAWGQYAFTTADDEGTDVLTDGRAEFAA
jgi:acyl dehydratase